MAFLDFTHIFWETTKLPNVLTDNITVTLFFQTKAFPPSLRNANENVWQSSFKLAYFAGSVSTAADFLSRRVLKTRGMIRLEIRQDIQKYRQHPLRWQYLPWITQKKSSSSPCRLTMKTRPENRHFLWKNFSDKCKWMDSKWKIMFFEDWCPRVHRDQRKHYVVFHIWNQRLCKNKSSARCRFSTQEFENENDRPTPWWKSTDMG